MSYVNPLPNTTIRQTRQLDAQLVHPFPCAKSNVSPINVYINSFIDCSLKFMVHVLDRSNKATKMARVRNLTLYNTIFFGNAYNACIRTRGQLTFSNLTRCCLHRFVECLPSYIAHSRNHLKGQTQTRRLKGRCARDDYRDGALQALVL